MIWQYYGILAGAYGAALVSAVYLIRMHIRSRQYKWYCTTVEYIYNPTALLLETNLRSSPRILGLIKDDDFAQQLADVLASPMTELCTRGGEILLRCGSDTCRGLVAHLRGRGEDHHSLTHGIAPYPLKASSAHVLAELDAIGWRQPTKAELAVLKAVEAAALRPTPPRLSEDGPVDTDWNTPAKDPDDYWARQEALAGINVVELLEVDPRDEIFGDLLYYHPDPLPARAQISGAMEIQAVLAQLIISDMIDAGLIDRENSGALQITEAGRAFADARLFGPDMNSIYRVREGAPSYGPLSIETGMALKYLILNDSPYVKGLLRDIYHPVLGRATFD